MDATDPGRAPATQPGRRSLQERHVAFAPLAPGQQFARLGRRHPEGGTNRCGSDDAPVLQLPTDRHAQPDGRQSISSSAPALIWRDLRFCWW
jgi:hypothetical protein